MRAWEYDQSLKDQGWATYYAVDADVFTTYGSVERQALRTKDRPGYSEVFFDDPPAGSYGLAERIVDHIFFHLQPGMPLLVIPPIDFEIRNILSAMTLRLGREPTPVTIDPEAIAAAIAEIRNLDRNEQIPPDILTHFSKLLSVQENSARAEYLRLSNLLELRRVVPSHALEIEDGYPKIVADAINSENDVAELYEHILLSSEWIDRLSKKPGVRLAEYRQQKLIRDAYALARLEIWNRKLADQKARVIYVTGAPHILNAALSYKKENINFFSTSIRHPRYFLASPEVVVRSDTSSNSEGKSSSQFFEWIVTFLADCRLDPATSYKSVGDFQIDQEFEKAAKVAFRRDPNLGADIQAKWRDYLLSIAASYVPPEQVLELTKRELRQSQQISALDDWKKFREKIDSRIEEENDRAWDDCFRTATRAGFFVGYEAGARKGEPPSRLVPPLRFDRWPQTEDFVKFMSEWRDPKSDIVAQYEARLEKVREETKGDFLYAYYLAHAALFAARGDWRIGAILSVRAIGKASHPEPENETTGHGREACYLAAYCLRHRFKTISDLVEAESYLDRAIAIYHKEIAKKPSLVALPDRFEAEKLAFTMTNSSIDDMGKVKEGKLVIQVRVNGTQLGQNTWIYQINF